MYTLCPIVHLVYVIIMYTIYAIYKDVVSPQSSYAIFLGQSDVVLYYCSLKWVQRHLGYDMLRSVIRFSHWHVYSDNCSCLIEQNSRTLAVV